MGEGEPVGDEPPEATLSSGQSLTHARVEQPSFR
jgi:hypothetical protein